MNKHKYTRAFTHLLRQCIKLHKKLKRSAVRWLTRVLRVNFRRQGQGGFVLPTTVMLLLIVTLVITTLLFRTLSRTSQVIVERNQQVIYNTATPAIDRAKAKLEYLFRQDTRLPAGVVSDSAIQSILQAPATGTDLYTFPGETRLTNFQDSSTPSNPGVGWYFTEGDKTIAYSIIFKKQATNTVGNTTTTYADVKNAATTKAPYFVVRNGPVNTNQSTLDNCGGIVQLAANERDWEPINSATLAKTFQVNAFVVDKPNSPNRTVTTLELQQDRQVDKGNKWGAYFHYDLEVAQDPTFRWNGAMHSDANMFFGPYSQQFKSYLISSPASCVNTSASDSKVTVSSYSTSGATTFQGQIIAGRLDKSVGTNGQQFGGASTFDLFNSNGSAPTLDQAFGTGTDSVTPGTATPADMAVEPVALLTEEVFKSRSTSDNTNQTYRDTAWKTQPVNVKKRIFNEETIPPYLDDTYRADNLYGPNPTYDGKPINKSSTKIPATSRVGDAIPSSDPNFDALTRNTAPDPKNPEALGLDGYWERRAVTGGLRVIVGQRLKLTEQLLPANPVTPSGMGREHEFLQRRTQKDNLAAVQATAVYHYQSGNGLTPVACLATTVHPGTAETLKRSSTFERMPFKRNVSTTDPVTGVVTTTLIDDAAIYTDFFTGRGTNGWEFSFPADTPQLQRALQNLANLGGDPHGAFPPRQDSALSSAVTGQIVTHPYPEMTSTFGDFSHLRRALAVPIGLRTIADQSYIDTASCTLGMLAYNMSFVTQYDYNQNWNVGDSSVALLDDLDEVIKGNGFPGNDSDQVIKMLEDLSNNAALSAADKAKYVEYVKLAKLVVTKEQTKRDRISASGGSACTNSTFVTQSNNAGGGGAVANQNGLQKLCPTGSKYPVLYYLFPLDGESHDEESSKLNRSSNPYITAVNPASTPKRYQVVNDADLSTIASTAKPKTDAAAWVTPRTDVTSSVGSGANLPNNNATGLNNLVKYVNAANATPTYYQVAFKDAALFNGREMMSVRALDIDLNLLRSTTGPGTDTWLPIKDNTAADPNAPPPSGVVYAFREDAVREDAIARPAGTVMDAIPGSLSDPTLNPVNGISTKPVDYYPDPDRRPYGFRLKNGSRLDRGNNTAGMSFVSNNSVYIQGDFNLHSTDGTNTDSNLLEEFKNDPPTSIVADNLGKLRADWSNFYLRTRKDERFAIPANDTWRPTEILGDDINILSNQFCAGSIQDGILNAGFPGNSIVGTELSRYGCSLNATYTSYLNQNRPTVALADLSPAGSTWQRENPLDSGSPIIISRNGKPQYDNSREYELANRPNGSNPPQTYLRFADGDTFCGVDSSSKKCIATANTTRVNAIIVQGIIPSRAGQSYGGFHMFPRMIENWNAQNLSMSGAFIQLRFSNQGTGSFDQEAWEPSAIPTATSEETRYFRPPNRLWGYDVALQYQTAGPVSRRFATPGTTRSEIYTELSVDDPYINKLRCATKTAADGGVRIDPTASCS